jgi:hypothetical protein
MDVDAVPHCEQQRCQMPIERGLVDHLGDTRVHGLVADAEL